MVAAKGLLAGKVPLNKDNFNADNAVASLNAILSSLRNFKGLGLAQGAIGLPDADFPASIVYLKQDGTTNFLLPEAVENRGDQALIKQLDCQIIEFRDGPTKVTGNVIFRLQNRRQAEQASIKAIPHLLGRKPAGFFPLGGLRVINKAGAGSEYANNAICALPAYEAQDERGAVDTVGNDIPTNALPAKDSSVFNLSASFPIDRALATGNIIFPLDYVEIAGRILLF